MTILHLSTSITGDQSVSRRVSRSIVDKLAAEHPGEQVIERDLVAEPLDHLTLAALADSSILDEFLAADTIVIGAPMYNFSIPTQLKSWLDRILVAGKTFRYTEHGPEGLAGGKRVIIALARGGFYNEGSPSQPFEHVETYLTNVFNFIGIDPEFVAADGIAIGPEQRAKALAEALDEVGRLAA
jgi:FMN-dependent NADH-azoreductase